MNTMWNIGTGATVKQNGIAFTSGWLTIDNNVGAAFGYWGLREAVVTTSYIIKTGRTWHRHSPLTVKYSF
ncbi:hypothetical protein PEC302110_06880 [Pectobacterium araliae]|uniref:Uncharacterized protein n=1 Tax=Pectobacterium araliae TaxID=3073862 RepID=A0AAN0KCX7_9GAMM|nr:hypothetical protein PEC302110_06880 [Pectobacterium sp. MAFF 302110]